MYAQYRFSYQIDGCNHLFANATYMLHHGGGRHDSLSAIIGEG